MRIRVCDHWKDLTHPIVVVTSSMLLASQDQRHILPSNLLLDRPVMTGPVYLSPMAFNMHWKEIRRQFRDSGAMGGYTGTIP